MGGGWPRPVMTNVRIWDVASGESRFPAKALRRVNAVAIAPDGRWLASAGGTYEEQAVGIWDVASGDPKGFVPRHYGRVYAVAIAGWSVAGVGW
jgi:WD40 repeat protein